MGVKFKPIYSCDGCGEDFEDPDKVRIFESIVKSGDGSKQYIKSGMFCLSCIPLALDFENKVPETVQIVDSEQALAAEENLSEKYAKLETDLTDIKKRYDILADTLKSITKDIKLNNTRLLAIEKELSKNSTEKQESLPADHSSSNELVEIDNINFLKHNDEQLTETKKCVEEHITSPKESQTTSQEPETSIENIDSETEEEDMFGEDQGKYLILKLIDNEITERKFAQKQGYKDIKDLREACGLSSLVGLYYSTTKYIDTPTNFITDLTMINDAKVINKIFFGVPNIVKRNVLKSKEMNIALIEKELFTDKIESVSFEVPEKPKDVEIAPKEEKNLISNISKDKLKSFINDAAKALNETKLDVHKEAEVGFREMKEAVKTATQKKKIFSRDEIGDEYI